MCVLVCVCVVCMCYVGASCEGENVFSYLTCEVVCVLTQLQSLVGGMKGGHGSGVGAVTCGGNEGWHGSGVGAVTCGGNEGWAW